MSEKQIALLMSTVALVLAALSASAIVIASAATQTVDALEKELLALRSTQQTQQDTIGQLTAGMLALAPILEASTGDGFALPKGTPSAEAGEEELAVLAVQAPATSKAVVSDAKADTANSPTEGNDADRSAEQRSVDSVLVQRIIENWVRPASAKNGMSVDILLKISRAGVITEATVVQSSGDHAFDKSATDAILAVNAVTEIQEISDETYQELYKERRVRFSPEDLSS